MRTNVLQERLLPPRYLSTLTLDPLDDDSRAMARALTLTGIANRLRREDRVLHGFLKHLRSMQVVREVLDEAAAVLAGLAQGRPPHWVKRPAQALSAEVA